ncbi:MAG TPA: hypothetical protein VG742_21250 [Dongiaceae bacterium]|nr:hypothetical protein [Dongiaceae bacterium]
MKHMTVLAMLAGAMLIAGCTASTEGVSLSESKFIDNNCSGNGWITNEAWCTDSLHPSAGPWAGQAM